MNKFEKGFESRLYEIDFTNPSEADEERIRGMVGGLRVGIYQTFRNANDVVEWSLAEYGCKAEIRGHVHGLEEWVMKSDFDYVMLHPQSLRELQMVFRIDQMNQDVGLGLIMKQARGLSIGFAQGYWLARGRGMYMIDTAWLFRDDVVQVSVLRELCGMVEYFEDKKLN